MCRCFLCVKFFCVNASVFQASVRKKSAHWFLCARDVSLALNILWHPEERRWIEKSFGEMRKVGQCARVGHLKKHRRDGMKWDGKRWDEVRRDQVRWDEMRWSVELAVWNVKNAVWGVKFQQRTLEQLRKARAHGPTVHANFTDEKVLKYIIP